jgi:CRP/FNR family transcriptional regulator, anaerobic regulatory protein
MDEHYQLLAEALGVHGYLSTEEIEIIFRYIKVEQLKRNDYFLHSNTRAGKVGFVVQGMLRAYIINGKGEENIQYIIQTGQFVSDVNAFYYRRPAKTDIRAIGKCVVFSIGFAELDMLCRQIPALEFVVKHWSETMLLLIYQMNEFKYAGDALAQYQYFIGSHSNLARQLPLSYIARLLQIAPPSLSRLRRMICTGSLYYVIGFLSDCFDVFDIAFFA